MGTRVKGYEDGKPYGEDGKFIYPSAKNLPHTHFRTDDDWILVRDAGVENLPKLGQEIMFVLDDRGSYQEMHRNMFPNIFSPMPDQRVRHGWASDVGYFEPLGVWFLEVIDSPVHSGRSVIVGPDDAVTYWKPMPLPPKDTYVRSPFNYHEIYTIAFAEEALIEERRRS